MQFAYRSSSIYHWIPLFFRIWTNLAQFTCSDAFCQCMKQALISSSVSTVHSDIILSIPIWFLVSLPLLNPSCLILFSNFLVSVLATVFAAHSVRMIECWSLSFVAFFGLLLEINFSIYCATFIPSEMGIFKLCLLVHCAGFIVSRFLILSLKKMFLILPNFYGMLVIIINYVSRLTSNVCFQDIQKFGTLLL